MIISEMQTLNAAGVFRLPVEGEQPPMLFCRLLKRRPTSKTSVSVRL